MPDYFGNQPQQTPIMPPTQEQAPLPPTQMPITSDFKGLPVRGNGDKIFLLKGGKKHWVQTKEVYEKLGFKFGDERKLDEATLAIIPEGEIISG